MCPPDSARGQPRQASNRQAAFELFRRAGLCATGGEARRLIRSGGGRLNDAAVDTETRLVTLGDLQSDGVIKPSAGKKRHALVRAV